MRDVSQRPVPSDSTVLARIASYGARVVTVDESEYPQGLRDLQASPPWLIVAGRVPVGGIAIVGSRRPPERGLRAAYELARRCHEPVVSGLAAGVDGAAHRGALAAGIATIAYVAHGLGRTFPAAHRSLEQSIVGAGGAVASTRLPGESVSGSALVARDRLQAAHARATVLVSTESDGGAMHTMRFAAELRRKRYAFAPPPEEQGRSEWAGNLRALAEGAIALPLDDLGEAVRILHE